MERNEPTLGLSRAELNRLVAAAQVRVTEGGVPTDDLPTPAEALARRLAWEAAASLTAANNQRIAEQLRHLLQGARSTPASDRLDSELSH